MCVVMGQLSSLLGGDFLVQPFTGGIFHTFVGNSSFYALRKSNKLISPPPPRVNFSGMVSPFITGALGRRNCLCVPLGRNLATAHSLVVPFSRGC